MAGRVIVTVGTKRGAFLLESGSRRRKWRIRGPFLRGWSIPYAFVDTRGAATLHVGASHDAFGASVQSAPLRTLKFTAAETMPEFPRLNPKAAKFAKQYGIDGKPKVWILAPGPADRKDVLYMGTAPAGLFRSGDRGRTWEPVDGLNRHRTRKDWNPGAGGQCLHSIQIDPADPDRMWVAISAAGSFRTDDGGATWKPVNARVAKYVGAPKERDVST